MTPTTDGGALLAIETSTRWTTVAVGDLDGRCVASRADDRAGRTLLELVDAVLGEADLKVEDLRGVVVGTGPGSFTGLRVGMAMAKTLAFARGIDLVGIPTVEAMAEALVGVGASGEAGVFSMVIAAGARDHYLARVESGGGASSAGGGPRLLEPVRLVPPGTDLLAAVGSDLAVSIGGTEALTVLGEEAVARGATAVANLGPALLRLGAAALADGRRDDVATLVPLYVAMPRGVVDAGKEMAWSPDRP